MCRCVLTYSINAHAVVPGSVELISLIFIAIRCVPARFGACAVSSQKVAFDNSVLFLIVFA